ncbi:hypothetical protein P7K49_002060 [Saguinus oedipus]|uniref:Uncharacterized protein n=1 Tax=Saguinus oedipus TaxID=9490 RepID=A0ABQ9WG86_SAGOE|nr:hypothetical protein P7K49_002060 [Saguinus oedipus]
MTSEPRLGPSVSLNANWLPYGWRGPRTVDTCQQSEAWPVPRPSTIPEPDPRLSVCPESVPHTLGSQCHCPTPPPLLCAAAMQGLLASPEDLGWPLGCTADACWALTLCPRPQSLQCSSTRDPEPRSGRVGWGLPAPDQEDPWVDPDLAVPSPRALQPSTGHPAASPPQAHWPSVPPWPPPDLEKPQHHSPAGAAIAGVSTPGPDRGRGSGVSHLPLRCPTGPSAQGLRHISETPGFPQGLRWLRPPLQGPARVQA